MSGGFWKILKDVDGFLLIFVDSAGLRRIFGGLLVDFVVLIEFKWILADFGGF